MDKRENIKDLILELPTISFGSHGPIVKALQYSLKRLGYYKGYFDGVCGNHTKAAIIKFQKDNALIEDGVFGPICWDALLVEKEFKAAQSGFPLTKEDCESAYARQDDVSFDSVSKSAKNIGLSELELVGIIAWVQGEGYWNINNPYLGYLSACVVINCILDGWYGRGNDFINKVASWGSYYSKDKQTERYVQGCKNPAVMKITYLALECLQTGIHACYGPDEKPEKIFYDPKFRVGDKNIYVW